MRLISPEVLEKLLIAIEGGEAAEKKEIRKSGAKVKAGVNEKLPRTVAPKAENPAMPRRSIFDDDDEIVKKPAVKLPKPAEGKKRQEIKPAGESRISGKKKPVNPVVKLPEKKKASAIAAEKRDERKAEIRFPAPHTKKQQKTAANRKRTASSGKRPLPKMQSMNPKEQKKREIRRQKTVIPKKVNPSKRRSRAYAAEETTFFEKHARSVIAMALLAVTVIGVILWGSVSSSGRVTFAQMGVGSAEGYILMGDECMEEGNYARAVEYYYQALSKETSYEAAKRLADAYRKTGDIDMETSALLLCVDKYPGKTEAAERLKELYPEPVFRPESVREALKRYEN